MNKKLKIVAFVALVIVIIATWLYLSYSKKIEQSFDEIKKINNVLLPSLVQGPQRDDNASILDKNEIIYLTNLERVNNGEVQLEDSIKLDEAANDKLEDMFLNQYFEHISPIDGSDISNYVFSKNYSYLYVGENLALGDFKDEQEMVKAWMDSPGHRENILNTNYTEIGVAVKKSNIFGRNTWMAVQVFGSMAKDCSMPDQELLKEINLLKIEYSRLDVKKEEIKTIQDESKALIDEGNNNISKGNDIYESTNDYNGAKQYWDLGEQQYEEGIEKNNFASGLVDDLNKIISESNSLDNLIVDYNIQVNTYNKCIGE